jgi:dUTP pyrophosphatase
MIITGMKAYRMGVVENLISPEMQIQPAGIELTLNSVWRFMSSGTIDFTNKHRVIPNAEQIPFDEEGKVHLERGAYKIVYNEIVKMPKNMIAIGLPRSSLLRCGATIHTALWDPGYIGRSESLLYVYNEHGITLYRNARIIQLIFIELEEEPHKTYEGRYQKENIDLS